ncbi:hypothetical protein V8E36_002300 [Tilletia maclaganii]
MLLKVGLNDFSIEREEHTPLANHYFFQCPRCRGVCNCETCTEAAAPAGKSGTSKPAGQGKGKSWAGFMQESGSNQKKTASKPKSSTSKKATTANAKASGSDETKAAGKDKKKDDAAAPKGKGKAKDKEADKDKDGKTKDKASAAAAGGPAAKKVKVKAVAKKPLNTRPPPPRLPNLVPPPKVQTIETRLPVPNIEARIYVYETIVRLTDVIKVPKGTLGSLDRFDAWTSRQCQQLLERMLAAAAGMPYIDRGQPSKNTGAGAAVRAYREFGSQPSRGEPWAAARELIVKQLGHDVEELPAVDRTAEEEREREEEDRLAAIAAAAEIPTLRVTRRMAAAERRLMGRYESESDTDRTKRGGGGSSSSRNGNGNGRGPSTANGNGGGRSSRQVSSGSRTTSGNVSRSRRRDLLGDSEDDDDDADSISDDASEGSSGSRRGGSGARPRAGGRKAVLRDSDDEDSDGDANMSDAPSVESAGSAYQASDDEGGSHQTATGTAATSPPESVQSGAKKSSGASTAADTTPVAEPVPAPHLEAKIAILCGLCDVVLQTSDASKEIKAGVDGVVVAEREHKANLAGLEKEWTVAKEEISKDIPSMASEGYQAWKEKRAAAERNHKWAVIQENVRHQLQLDTLKIRTGPIGKDMDGRVYWQLSEYVEKMPTQTGGRWAWCLLIEGPPFPAPDQPNGNGHGPVASSSKKNDDGASTSSDLSSISSSFGSNHSSALSSIPSEIEKLEQQQIIEDAAAASRPFGGFDEQGRPRNNFEVSIPVRRKENGGSGSSVASSLSSLSATSKYGKEAGAKEAEASGRAVMGTNYPSEIKQIIDWLKWRCDMNVYQGTMQQITRKEPFTLAEIGEQTVQQTRYRAAADELIKALTKVREYYIWHLEELTSIE